MANLIDLLIHPSQEYQAKMNAACWAEIELKCKPLWSALYPKKKFDVEDAIEKMPAAKRIWDKYCELIELEFDAVLTQLGELRFPQTFVLDTLLESMPMQPAYRRDLISMYLHTKTLPPKPSRWLTAVDALIKRSPAPLLSSELPTETMSQVRRDMRDTADQHSERYRAALSPHQPVGGSYFDDYIMWELLITLLRELNAGVEIEHAVATADATCRATIRNWNAKKEWQLHRSEAMIEPKLLYWSNRLRRATNDQA